MRRAVVLFILILSSCVSRTKSIPEPLDTSSAVKYCGGELWGYVVPLGVRESKTAWGKRLQNQKLLLAAFLQMHSDLEEDPDHSLTFHLAIRSKHNLSIQIPEHIVKVRIDDADELRVAMDFSLIAEAKTAAELFPYPKYESRVVDPELNKWHVAQLDGGFMSPTQTAKVMILPSTKVLTLTKHPEKTLLDPEKFKEFYVQSSKNIWPLREPLQRSTIQIEIPRMVVNGQALEPRRFEFEMNYEEIKSERALSLKTPCPSIAAVFQRNEGPH